MNLDLKLQFVYGDHRWTHIAGDCHLELLAAKMNAHGFFTAMIVNVDHWTRWRLLLKQIQDAHRRIHVQ